MSDRIAVFNQGKIEQIGTPAELYEHPATPFVAGFVGVSNSGQRLSGPARSDRLDGAALTIRPEKIHLLPSRAPPAGRGPVHRRRPDPRRGLPGPVHPLPGRAGRRLRALTWSSSSRTWKRPRWRRLRRAGGGCAWCWKRAHNRPVRRPGRSRWRAMQNSPSTAGAQPRPRTPGRLDWQAPLDLPLPPPLAHARWCCSARRCSGWGSSTWARWRRCMLSTASSTWTIHRPGGAAVHAANLRAAVHAGQPGHRRAHRADGGGGDGRLRGAGLPAGLLHGPLRLQPRYKGLAVPGVLLPLWSSYLVRVYAWRLILAKEGIFNWFCSSGSTWTGC